MKKISQGNLFKRVPARLKKEVSELLFKRPGLGIYRILSQGQTTDWLKQDDDEWVVLLSGAAKIAFKKGNREVSLQPGDHLCIPAGRCHRVSWADPAQKTVWLAVHHKS